MATFDENAVPFDNIDFDIRTLEEPCGAALPRTPYNLESVAIAAAKEAYDLAGPSCVARVIKVLVDAITREQAL